MNLKDMITEINSALDYNPDLKQYDDNVARVINRHYLQVSSQYQWLFMHKRHIMILRKDIEGSTTDTLTSDGSRVVTLPITIGAGIKNLPSDIVGQTLVINNIEYLITAQNDAREFVVDRTIPAATHTSWTIKYMNYPMPRDSVEVLGIMDRGLKDTEEISFSVIQPSPGTDTTTNVLTAPNRGRFMFLDARKEEYLYLDRQDTGEPFVSIEEMHSNLRPPEFSPTVRSSVSTLDNRAVRDATYEYCYTFIFAGKESPPSPVGTVVIPDEAIGFRVELSEIMDTSASNTGDESSQTGRLKKIYRRVAVKPKDRRSSSDSVLKTGMGPWRHIATLSEDITSYFDDFNELTTATIQVKGTPTDLVSPEGDGFALDHLNEIGPRQYLRFWYTPSSDYPIEIRYHRRPFRLVNDSDSPQWPVQYHHYLVYAALKDICMQHGMLNNAQLYDVRSKELLERMKSKYLSRTDRLHIRRGFDRAMADRERFGIPSKS